MRINSFDQVKAFFDENKCDLLENCYINAHAKMKYRCSCGNVSFINFNNFKTKHLQILTSEGALHKDEI